MIVARVLLITVMIALGSIAQVSAFSLGPINVKSKFGERFDAEIELTAKQSEKKSVAETVAAPYVVYVSSHLDVPTTRRVVNELRRKGLSAYSSPIPIDDKRKIYRVYVGRYNSWDLAREVTKQVRKLSLGKYAILASAPYVLES